MSVNGNYSRMKDSKLGAMIKCSPCAWRNIWALGSHCDNWEMDCLKVIQLKRNRHVGTGFGVINGYKAQIASGKEMMRVSGKYYTNKEWMKLSIQNRKEDRTIHFVHKNTLYRIVPWNDAGKWQYINDPIGGSTANAEFVYGTSDGFPVVDVVSTRTIKSSKQILVSYGDDYWRTRRMYQWS